MAQPAQLTYGDVAAERSLEAPVEDGLAERLLLVPLRTPPLTVRAIEEEEGKEDEDKEGELGSGDLGAFLSSLLGMQDVAASEGPSGPMRFFSDMAPLTPLPVAEGQGGGGQGDNVVVLRLGRGLKSLPEPSEVEVSKNMNISLLARRWTMAVEQPACALQPRESRVLEDDPDDFDDGDEEQQDLGLRREHLRSRRALRLVVRQAPAEHADDAPQGRADATTAAPGSFLETVQNQLPGQLQGLGGAMEDSRMIVGTFQAVIMPGSAATDMGQQIQGFISNMPQMPSLPGGTG